MSPKMKATRPNWSHQTFPGSFGRCETIQKDENNDVARQDGLKLEKFDNGPNHISVLLDLRDNCVKHEQWMRMGDTSRETAVICD